MRKGKKLDSAEKVLDPAKVCYGILGLHGCWGPQVGMLKTRTVDDVLAKMDSKNAGDFRLAFLLC
jgi:hypothetical protein